MEPAARAPQSREQAVAIAFVSLTILAGAVSGYAIGAVLVAVQLQVYAGMALASLIAGAILMGVAVARRQRTPTTKQWGALLLLLAPQWCSIPIGQLGNGFTWLHGFGQGTALLFGLAAPLWLALLSTLEIVEIEMPRRVVAAAIIGIGAVCLIVPANTLSVQWNQAPMLVLQSLLGIATVASWIVARPLLNELPAEVVAGGYLLLSALGDSFFSFVFERSSFPPLDWRALPVPILLDAMLLMMMWWLWFWLLQRMTLAGFSMRALAGWAAGMIPGLAMGGITAWRVDAAVVSVMAAVAVALRARVAEEQPTALGLNSD